MTRTLVRPRRMRSRCFRKRRLPENQSLARRSAIMRAKLVPLSVIRKADRQSRADMEEIEVFDETDRTDSYFFTSCLAFFCVLLAENRRKKIKKKLRIS
ncbi:hypothetical protein [Paraburkholderia sp. BL6669N2]|uniref:hypothetical protein n=1 Tax=Paraburkholderia sp. BL6669N2 TaxID=1938807 RepID=UPI002161151E